MNIPMADCQNFFSPPTTLKPPSRIEKALLILLDTGMRGLTVFDTLKYPRGYECHHIPCSLWTHCLSSYVSSIQAKDIQIDRRREPIANTRHGRQTRYWIKDHESAMRAIALCNHYRKKRGEEPLQPAQVLLILRQFPADQDTIRE
nr:hypothetical protein [Endozoicomonas sp.]